MYTAQINISLKPGVLDAEGKTVAKNLELLGYPIKKVTTLKVYEVEVEAKTKEEAERILDDACRKMLANPVIQDYEIKLL